MVITPLRAHEGNLLGCAKITRDLTERRQAEERFRLVVESTPNAMVMANHEGLIVLVNSQTERLFGYRRDELIGQPDAGIELTFQDNGPGIPDIEQAMEAGYTTAC